MTHTGNVLSTLRKATKDTGESRTANLAMISYALALVGEDGRTTLDGRISALVSHAFLGYLAAIDGFGCVLATRRFKGGIQAFSFAGVDWLVHPGILGKGTHEEECFLFHDTAISSLDDREDYLTADFVLLEPGRVVKIKHDGSAFAPL